MKSKRFLKYNLIVVICVLLLGVLFFYIDNTKINKEIEEVWAKHQAIDINKEIDGAVTNIHNFSSSIRVNPNSANVSINDSIHYRIRVKSKPIEYETFLDVLKVGVSLKKEVGSDKLLLIDAKERDTLVYEFRLLDDKGYPIK